MFITGWTAVLTVCTRRVNIVAKKRFAGFKKSHIYSPKNKIYIKSISHLLVLVNTPVFLSNIITKHNDIISRYMEIWGEFQYIFIFISPFAYTEDDTGNRFTRIRRIHIASGI